MFSVVWALSLHNKKLDDENKLVFLYEDLRGQIHVVMSKKLGK